MDVHRKIQLLRHVFAKPKTQEAVPEACAAEADIPEIHPRPKKTRWGTERVVKVTAENLRDQLSVCAPNRSMLTLNAYQNFKMKLVEVGTLMWRLHTDDRDSFILNEYGTDGELKLNSFVELTLYEDGLCTCSCETYKVIAAIASQDAEDTLPDGLLCMHCRFMREEMRDQLPSILSDNAPASSHLALKLQQSKSSLNDPVVRLTDGGGTSKFSVRASNDLAFVSIAASGFMVVCSSGMCAAVRKHTKTLKKLLQVPAEQASKLCPHLATMVANREIWRPAEIPTAPEEDEAVTDEPLLLAPSEEQVEFVSQNKTKKHLFDPTTSKWDFGGYSNHQPSGEYDISASRTIQARMHITDGTQYKRNPRTGIFEYLRLIPDLPTNDCGRGPGMTNGMPPSHGRY
ncbi:uncharacterized protein LOC135489271 [Lineus longissimus]|uniref:uncharacterized protein LOC135489271 n=1 Tax=Lineus longissimus TaxID=88925 RepID=UPI00315C8A2C